MLKYEIVREEIKKIIYKLNPDDILPSYDEFAKKYNVSDITVRKALNELKNEGLIYGHRGKGIFVSANNKEIKNIHFVTHELNTKYPFCTDFYPTILEEIQEQLFYKNINTIYSFHKNKIDYEKNILEIMCESNPYGVILIPTAHKNNIELYKKLVDKVSNLVCIDIPLPYVESNYVACDAYNDAYKMASVIDYSEYDKVVIISDNLSDFEKCPTNLRIKAFLDVMSNNRVGQLEVIQSVGIYDFVINRVNEVIENNINKYDKIVFLFSNSTIANYVLENYYDRIGKLKKCHIVSFEKVVKKIPKNINVTYSVQNVPEISKKAVELLLNNSQEINTILIPSLIYNM